MTTSAACAAVNSAPVTRSSAVVRRPGVSFGGRLAVSTGVVSTLPRNRSRQVGR